MQFYCEALISPVMNPILKSKSVFLYGLSSVIDIGYFLPNYLSELKKNFQPNSFSRIFSTFITREAFNKKKIKKV